MSRSLGSNTAAESFLKYSAKLTANVRAHTQVAGRLEWGLILAEFNLAIFSCSPAKFSRYTVTSKSS